MRLTTRLMQVASWLLVQRAVDEGEMTEEEAVQRKISAWGQRKFAVAVNWRGMICCPTVF